MTFPIAPTAGYASLVAERDHTAVVASLRPFFEARSVAVIGASSRRGTIGGELFRNILKGEYAGAAYPVNRNGEPVAGVRGYGSMLEIPDPIDLAVVCVPAAAVLEAVESALEAGVRAVCVISAGFAEVGSEGRSGSARCSPSFAHTEHDSWDRTALEFPPRRSGSMRRSRHVRRPPGTSASPPRAAHSGSHFSRLRSRAASACPRSSRSGTRRTSPRTTCSSGGRMTPRPKWCSSTSSRSAIRAGSGRSPVASPERSRSSP